jgi:hypothetical protein
MAARDVECLVLEIHHQPHCSRELRRRDRVGRGRGDECGGLECIDEVTREVGEWAWGGGFGVLLRSGEVSQQNPRRGAVSVGWGVAHLQRERGLQQLLGGLQSGFGGFLGLKRWLSDEVRAQEIGAVSPNVLCAEAMGRRLLWERSLALFLLFLFVVFALRAAAAAGGGRRGGSSGQGRRAVPRDRVVGGRVRSGVLITLLVDLELRIGSQRAPGAIETAAVSDGRGGSGRGWGRGQRDAARSEWAVHMLTSELLQLVSLCEFATALMREQSSCLLWERQLASSAEGGRGGLSSQAHAPASQRRQREIEELVLRGEERCGADDVRSLGLDDSLEISLLLNEMQQRGPPHWHTHLESSWGESTGRDVPEAM